MAQELAKAAASRFVGQAEGEKKRGFHRISPKETARRTGRGGGKIDPIFDEYLGK